MGQKKLKRFAELLEFRHVLQYPENMPGRWKEIFGNDRPITLELACGKGEYTIGLARLFPDRNFLGVDVKGNRLWVGARAALWESLSNAAFLRTQIDQISRYFNPGEVEEIWLTFPDPQLRISRVRKRLTHPKFLRLYQQILKPGGYIHLKTDSPVLYRFTLQVAELYGLPVEESIDDLYALADPGEVLSIQTHYEKLDIAGSQRVHYIRFRLPASIPDKDELLKELIRETEPGEGD